MPNNFNGLKDWILRYARLVAEETQNTGKSPEEVLRDPKIYSILAETTNIKDGTERIGAILQRPEMQELKLEEGKPYANSVMDKLKELNALVGELPDLIERHHRNVETINATERAARDVMEQYDKQAHVLKQVAKAKLEMNLLANQVNNF